MQVNMSISIPSLFFSLYFSISFFLERSHSFSQYNFARVLMMLLRHQLVQRDEWEKGERMSPWVLLVVWFTTPFVLTVPYLSLPHALFPGLSLNLTMHDCHETEVELSTTCTSCKIFHYWSTVPDTQAFFKLSCFGTPSLIFDFMKVRFWP